jgi:rsbT co-antagonist protein RsbR
MVAPVSILASILHKHEVDILEEWIALQRASAGQRTEVLSRTQLHEQSRTFLALLRAAVAESGPDINAPGYAALRQRLDDLSIERARQGYSPSETATFVFSLKQPLFSRLRTEFVSRPEEVADAMWESTLLLDALGLYTTEVYQRGREQVMVRQQEEVLELSTPVVTLWDGVLALPLIGTLDSSRTQVVMENLLQRIVETGASLAVIDITGVPTVDTLTAQHLMKTIAAARLMGADCILSGIRPQIAQTIVHLGVDLGSVITKATLADAFSVALERLGLTVKRAAPAADRAERKQGGDGEEAGWNASRS